MLDEERDIVGALAQRRNRERHDRQAIEEVEPKPATIDLGAQVAMRRRDDTNVDRKVAPTTEPAHLAALEHA